MSYFNDRKIVIGSSNQGKMAEIKELFDIFHLKPNLKIANDFTDVIPEENGYSFDENALIKARFYANITGLPVITDDSGLEIHHLNGFPGINTAPYAKSLGGYKFAFADLEKRLIESESREIMKDHLRGEGVLASELNQPNDFRVKTSECTNKYMIESESREIMKDHLRGEGVLASELNQPNDFRVKTSECTNKYMIESESREIMKDHLRGEARRANFHCSICYYLPSGEYYIFSAKVFGTLTFPARGEDRFGFDPIFIPDGYDKSFAELGAKKSLISHRYKAFEQFINHFSNK